MRRLTRLELGPPSWLVRAIAPKPAAFPWPESVQAVLAITGPLAFGLLTGQLPSASFLAIGGLTAATTNTHGPLPWRLRRSSSALVAAAVGLAVGLATGAQPLLAIAAMLVLALVAALISVIGAIASLAALELLVYAAVGSSLAGRVPLLLSSGEMLLGGIWGLCLTVVVGLVVGYRRPEREAVARVFQRIAELLAATGAPWREQARRALTDALNDAFDELLGVRSRTGGRAWPVLRLTALLNSSAPLVEATVGIAYSGRRPHPALHDAAAGLAEAIRGDQAAPHADLGETDSPLLSAWRRAYQGVLQSWHRAVLPATPPTPGERLGTIADQILAGRGTWRFVIRLVLCMTIAEVLEQVLPIARSYWIAMTVAIVLKPDFGSVFVRGLQRGLGTIAGVILGFGMLLVLPDRPLLFAGIAVLGGLLPYAILLNYGMFSTFLTPLVLLLLELITSGGH
ncbi:MAG: FUSC family protein, partial [Candidatus Dormibacteraceae bacterium]